jgi:L-rhamnose-H+ transport protein
MSACFAFALQAGKPINEASSAANTPKLWTGLPALVVLLWGGFTTNFIWCVVLNLRNATGYQYLASVVRPEHAHHGGDAGLAASSSPGDDSPADLKIPVLANYLFSAAAGTTWYFQFFFYTMGATQMGKYDFASWTLHMASIIIFGTMWGWILREWKGSGKKAHMLIAAGVATLVLSTIIIGFGTYLKSRP